MQPNANQAAYPRAYQEHVGKDGKMEVITCGAPGLTKREAFAAQILAGIIAADRDVDPTVVARVYPQAAVRYADELLTALERKPS